MARKKRRQAPEGPTVRFVLGCRRGINVDQRVGKDLDGETYLERTTLTTYEGRAHVLERPTGWTETEELSCPLCNRKAKVHLASPLAATLSQYQGCLWILVLGGLITALCATLPDIVAASTKYFHGPLGIAGIVGGMSGVALVFFAIIGLMEPPLAHSVWTTDYKHIIMPDAEEEDEDEE